jgi:hypothetical protein
MEPYRIERQDIIMVERFTFVEYNGHSAGYASWLLFSLLTDDTNAADACYKMFEQGSTEKARSEFQQTIREMIKAWTTGKSAAYPEVIGSWAKDTLGYLCKSAYWGPIYDALRGAASLPENVDEITKNIYDVFTTVKWQDIVGDATALVDRDGALFNWLNTQLTMWVESSRARSNTKTSISRLATHFLQIAVDSVDFDHIAEYFASK